MKVGKLFFQTGAMQAVRLVSGVGRAKLIATYLGPAGVGVFAQAQNLQSLLLTVGSLSLATGYVQRIRHLNARYSEEYRNEVHGTVLYTLLASLCLVLLGLSPFLNWLEGHAFSGNVERGFTGFVLWSVLFVGLVQVYLEPRLIANERYGDYVKATCASSLLGVGALWILLASAGGWALGIFLLFTACLSCSFSAFFVFRHCGPRPLIPRGWKWSHLRPILKVSVALIASGLAFYGTAVWLRALVLGRLGAEYAGYIQVPVVLSGYYTPLLSHVIWNVFHVKLSRASEDQSSDRVLSACFSFVLLFQPLITIWIMTFPGIAVGLVYTEQFRHGIGTFPLQFIGDYFYFLLTVLSVKILAQNRIKLYTLLWLFFSAVEAAAGALFILEIKLALRSLAAAYLIASALTFAVFFLPAMGVSWWQSKRAFKFNGLALPFGLAFLVAQALLLRADAHIAYRLAVALAYSALLGGLAWHKKTRELTNEWKDLASSA